MASKSASKPLLHHLARGPLLAIAGITVACIIVTVTAINALLGCALDDTATRTALTVNRLTHSQYSLSNLGNQINQLQLSKADSDILIFEKAGLSVSSNRHNSQTNNLNAREYTQLRKEVAAALKANRYPVRTTDGKTLIFPLATLRDGKDSAYFRSPVIEGMENLVHDGETGAGKLIANMFHHVLHSTPHTFSPPAGTVAGAIAVKASNTWMSEFVLTIVLVMSIISVVAFAAMAAIMSFAVERFVRQPLKKITAAMRSRQRGEEASGVSRTSVREFDILAVQWNSLLRAQDSAAEHNRVLSRVLENVPIGVMVATPDARIEYANPAICKLGGYDLFEMIGKTPKQLFLSPKVDPAVWLDAETTVKSGKPWNGEVLSLNKAGEEFQYHLTLFPILDTKGNVERVVSLRRDISEQKMHERALVEARRRAEAADRAKSEFISNMSHELRTPLHSIIGFSSLLREEKLGPLGSKQYVDFSQMIENSAQNLLGVINSILDYSRMDAGIQQAEHVPLATGDTLKHLVERLSHRASENGIDLHFENRTEGKLINGDERALRQMAKHLLNNAIKFNKPGGKIDMAIRVDGRNRLVLSVHDTGIGIPRNVRDRITAPFFQVDGSTARKHDGVGLGLALVREIVDAHGASLKISEPTGGGTTVTVIFPAERTLDSQIAKKAAIA